MHSRDCSLVGGEQSLREIEEGVQRTMAPAAPWISHPNTFSWANRLNRVQYRAKALKDPSLFIFHSHS